MEMSSTLSVLHNDVSTFTGTEIWECQSYDVNISLSSNDLFVWKEIGNKEYNDCY